MNLRVLKKSQRQPEVGDVFVMQLDGKNFLFGRVVSIDANPLGVGGGILIYIYRAKAPCKMVSASICSTC